MIELRQVTLSLLEINPTNHPFIDQWIGVKNYGYRGTHTDILVVDDPDHGIVTRNGNHRLGKLAQSCGINKIITVQVVKDEEGEGFWDEMLTKARSKNIFTYDDFWRFAIANFSE